MIVKNNMSIQERSQSSVLPVPNRSISDDIFNNFTDVLNPFCVLWMFVD